MGSGMGKRWMRQDEKSSLIITYIRTWLYRHSLQYHNYHTTLPVCCKSAQLQPDFGRWFENCIVRSVILLHFVAFFAYLSSRGGDGGITYFSFLALSLLCMYVYVYVMYCTSTCTVRIIHYVLTHIKMMGSLPPFNVQIIDGRGGGDFGHIPWPTKGVRWYFKMRALTLPFFYFILNTYIQYTIDF